MHLSVSMVFSVLYLSLIHIFKMRKLTKTSKIVIWIIVIIVFIAFCIWQNNSIVVSHFVYHNSKLPADFNNYKIMHISDLHNKMFGAVSYTHLL